MASVRRVIFLEKPSSYRALRVPCALCSFCCFFFYYYLPIRSLLCLFAHATFASFVHKMRPKIAIQLKIYLPLDKISKA